MLTILIVTVFWMSLFTDDNARLPWLPHDFARAAPAAIADPERREQVAATLEKMAQSATEHNRRVGSIVRDVAILNRHRATMVNDFEAYLDHMTRKREIVQRKLIDGRMRLKKLMTRAEWAAALQAGGEPD